MAVLSGTNVAPVFFNGESDLVALYALRKVTAGDTFDLANDFSSPRQAFLIGTTVLGEEAVSLSGTVLTIPGGLSNDSGWLLVWGAHA